MYIALTILIVIACILLILIVLVQNPKGGGLASNFSSSNQIMGVRKTTDFLEKATWTLAGVMIVLSIFAVIAIPTTERTTGSKIERQIENNPANNQMIPSFINEDPVQVEPTAAPEEE